MDIPRDFV